MAVGAYPQIDHEAWLVGGVRELRQRRSSGGRWRSFPFFYSLLAISEFDYPEVLDELRFTLPALETILKRKPYGAFSQRRIDLATKILKKLT